MERSHRPGPRWWMLLLIAVLVVPSTGCIHRFLATMVYVVRGTNVDAAFDGLREKRVAVICSAPATLEYRYANADREVAGRIRYLLEKNVDKIDVVDTREIEQWTDQRDWENFEEMAAALDADMIVHVDMEYFNLEKGPTLYQGRSTAKVSVYDMLDGGREVWQKHLDEIRFPHNSAVPSQNKSLAQFRRQYVEVLAEHIARHFYPHDAHFDVALDSEAHY